MSKNILQFIVVVLAILIVICFTVLIIGMYLKISGNQKNNDIDINNYSLNLNKYENIIDIQVLNDSQLMFVIKNSEDIYSIVYDTDKNVIVSNIKR